MHTAFIKGKKSLSKEPIYCFKRVPLSLPYISQAAMQRHCERKQVKGKGTFQMIILFFLSQNLVKNWLSKTKVFVTVSLGEN